jgi:GNAT superfamily N-acetyltransferase
MSPAGDLRVDRYSDAAAFLGAAGPWLAAAELENTVMLGIARSIADGARIPREPPYFATATDGGEIDCCAVRTPPHHVLVTRGTPRGMAALAADAVAALPGLPGVIGPRESAAAFAEAWRALSGGGAEVSMRQRLHSIERVSADLPAVRGRLREAEPGERALAIEWAVSFAREAMPDRHIPAGESEEAVDLHLRSGTLHFWDDGRPVAMCATAAATATIARINAVYTPPDLRGRGYATAAVAALTRTLLDGKRRCCCLYTDLANATANGVYRRIGYRPVCDIDQYAFTDS